MAITRHSPPTRRADGGARQDVPFASAWRRAHLSVDERVARGRAARSEAPRSSHSQWEPAPDRPDPIGLLEEQARSRIPELVPVRYGRMLLSPFTFYRGAASIMAADLAATPTSGVTVQLCGDAHLSNFGVFGTPERRMLFDINDFDETLPGPWEWDLKRLAASFEVLGRNRGFSPSDRRAIVMAGAREYRERMSHAAKLGTLGAWYDAHHGERVVVGQRLMQGATDIFLGWQRIKGLDGVTRDYYVRQFHDWKGGATVENLKVRGATFYARLCAATLARAHARWGDRIAIASYLGRSESFDRAIADFSVSYADQNERDYEAFTAAVNSGRLSAQTGV